MRFGPRGAFVLCRAEILPLSPSGALGGAQCCGDVLISGLLTWCCNACGAQKGEQLLGQTFRLGFWSETRGLLLRAPGGKPEELNLFRDVHGL